MMVVLLIGMLFSAMAVIFRYQAVSMRQNDEMSEMNDDLRMASYWLAKDVREATSVIQLGTNGGGKGPGPNIGNAFKIVVGGTTISYYYGSGSKPNVFYRDKGGDLQPVTNEYLYGGLSKGYLRSWSVSCYDSANNPTTIPAQVKRVEFIFNGGYGDKPDNYKTLKTSATIRSGS
jgi:hypothetical protein